MTKPLFDTLAIIGPGLIGSSIMRAARAQGAVRRIVASARSPETRKRVIELGIGKNMSTAHVSPKLAHASSYSVGVVVQFRIGL